ncbi:MAG: NACHT domain-containing protein [Clostridia bacterium]|nr:NACHT domain-containing protein [Bacteroidales bacterium]MBR3918419.1 NACHT domain-containing protein [Clostridia bacterium]
MITIKEKHEILTKLSDSEFGSMFERLLDNQKFSNIQNEETAIICEQRIMGRITVFLFVLYTRRLSGLNSDDIVSIYQKIEALQNKYAANSVFIVSRDTISEGFKQTLSKNSTNINPTYIEREELLSLIEEYYSDFWRHDDQNLLAYEKQLLDELDEDTELRKLSFSEDKYKKKLDFFIEPHLSRCYEDLSTKTIVRKKYSVHDVITSKSSILIQGEAGCGKSTLLKKIAKKLIEDNPGIKNGKKNLPLYITVQDLIIGINDIKTLIQDKLNIILGEAPLGEIKDKYYIHILIDSIDELDELQSKILSQLQELERKYGVKYYIASRNTDIIQQNATGLAVEVYDIRRYNLEQIKHFLDAFFSGEEGKANNLLSALRENKIIDKLPLTPLNLSLISILFEEKDFEIPATISDIYDNFNALIVGRAVVSSKVEFIDVYFKERILSIYALELLKRPTHQSMDKDEFEQFFINYFNNKSLPIKKGTLSDALDYIVKHTGILFLKDGKFVQFTHASYMEYYAAVEIFKFDRERKLEQSYIDNFYDPNWQNSSVFYAGKSKDMPEFLQNVLNKVKKGRYLYDYMSGIMGCGYLIQALYLTDNKIRKEVIIECLRQSLLSLEAIKILAIENRFLYKNYKLPLVQIINFIYFYEIFNSITLLEPMRMAFEELHKRMNKLVENGDESSLLEASGLGYNLVELAFTMDSRRIGSQKELETIISSDFILKDPSLLLLTDFSMALLGKIKYDGFRKDLQKNVSTLAPAIKELIDQPIQRLRFTPLDTINPQKKVKLLVEGKTDAEILSHAYTVLTGGFMPYWSIQPSGRKKDTGSADEVKETILHSYPLLDKDDIIIGIVDHDQAGLSAYGYLKNDFDEIYHNKWKKHHDGEIHMVCLPVPGEMDFYLKTRHEDNFFEIEHYFGHEYLISKNVISKTEIMDIYKVNDGRKTNFSKEMNEVEDPHVFEHFLHLFKLIDQITGVDVSYII